MSGWQRNHGPLNALMYLCYEYSGMTGYSLQTRPRSRHLTQLHRQPHAADVPIATLRHDYRLSTAALYRYLARSPVYACGEISTMRGGLRRAWYFLWCEEVGHPFFGWTLHQCAPRVDVTQLLLTQAGTRSRMPCVFTSCSKREHPTEPILTESHSQCRP